MKNKIIVAMASACVLAASSARAALNLVQDPGFEGGETGTLTGSTSPWFSVDNTGDTTAINTSNPHSGSYNAVATGTDANLLQSLTLTSGIGYTINAWLATPGGAGGTLQIDLNGTVAGNISISGSSAYQEINWTATPTSSSGLLGFIWTGNSSSSALDIDDVSVAVPEPSTMVAGALMVLPFGSCAVRKLRRKSQAA
jgi:hypothetical protein